MRPGKNHRKPGKSNAIPALWLKATLEREAKREKMRIRILEQISSALTTLEKKYYWDEAYLFGSVAQKGKFRENSDIDIAIEGSNRLDHYAFTGDISEFLDIRVDVVLLEECPFAESIKEKGLKWNRKTGF
jgi:predicted nucleotidyltransferase